MSLITRRTAAKAMAVFGFGCSAAVAQDDAQKERDAGDDCVQGDGCLFRLALVGKGEITHRLNPGIPCEIGTTAHGSGSMVLTVEPDNLPCHELMGVIPPGSKLDSALHTLRRMDDLAFICGTFGIRDPNDVLLFEGDVSLLHRVNTHVKQFGNDPCDRRDHLQGWLTGTKTGDAGKQTLLRAMLVARTNPRDEGNAGYAVAQAQINGVVIKRAGQ